MSLELPLEDDPGLVAPPLSRSSSSSSSAGFVTPHASLVQLPVFAPKSDEEEPPPPLTHVPPSQPRHADLPSRSATPALAVLDQSSPGSDSSVDAYEIDCLLDINNSYEDERGRFLPDPDWPLVLQEDPDWLLPPEPQDPDGDPPPLPLLDPYPFEFPDEDQPEPYPFELPDEDDEIAAFVRRLEAPPASVPPEIELMPSDAGAEERSDEAANDGTVWLSQPRQDDEDNSDVVWLSQPPSVQHEDKDATLPSQPPQTEEGGGDAPRVSQPPQDDDDDDDGITWLPHPLYEEDNNGHNDRDSDDDDEIVWLTPPTSPRDLAGSSAAAPATPEPEEPKAYVVAYIENLGHGLVATRDISQGEEIMREAPFLTTPDPVTAEGIEAAFEALSSDNRTLYLSFKRMDSDDDVLEAIAETNSIPCYTELDGPENRRCGMFKDMCRLNHSCRPNCVWRWDPADGKQVLRALRDITCDEQLVVPYIDNTHACRAERRKELRNMGFKCLCEACKVSRRRATASDTRLAVIKEAKEEWDARGEGAWFSIRRSYLKQEDVARTRILDILARIDLEQQYLLLPLAYQERFILEATWGNWDATVAAANDLYRSLVPIFGPETASFQVVAWQNNPSSYPNWCKFDPIKKQKMSMRADSTQSEGEASEAEPKPIPRKTHSRESTNTPESDAPSSTTPRRYRTRSSRTADPVNRSTIANPSNNTNPPAAEADVADGPSYHKRKHSDNETAPPDPPLEQPPEKKPIRRIARGRIRGGVKPVPTDV